MAQIRTWDWEQWGWKRLVIQLFLRSSIVLICYFPYHLLGLRHRQTSPRIQPDCFLILLNYCLIDWRLHLLQQVHPRSEPVLLRRDTNLPFSSLVMVWSLRGLLQSFPNRTCYSFLRPFRTLRIGWSRSGSVRFLSTQDFWATDTFSTLSSWNSARSY